MKKNDKLIVVFGVFILVIASVGIYSWDINAEMNENAKTSDFVGITGDLKDMPDSIIVSVNDPFYALAATPVAVNYNKDGQQSIVPLLVKDFDNPSSAVTRFFGEQVGIHPDLEIDGSESAEDVSIMLAEQFWEQSDAALLIEDTAEAYELGVAIAPVASYLRIPIIIANKSSTDYIPILGELDVAHTLICGNLDAYGNYIRFTSIDEVIDFSVEIIREKFEQEVDYITLTNPLDAFPPKVLDSKKYYFGPATLQTSATTAGMIKALTVQPTNLGTFKIPDDYKYALIRYEGVNLDYDGVDEFGDSVSFNAGNNDESLIAALQKNEAFSGNTRTGGWGDRDANGNIIRDYVYGENVLYDRGGSEYTVKAKGTWLTKKQGDVEATVIIEKLENPKYPMMKGLSSIAPYLTAYRKGIIFAKPEFAFTADDNIIDSKGNTLPGSYMPFRNIGLIELSNDHMEKEIHEPLNNLLAKLAEIEMEDSRDIKYLRDHYVESPVYIALVGGATMLPQYYYDNYNQPVDVETGNYGYGSGTPSDVYYGNIDPIKGDWTNLADDVYSEYPFQENIVGRITGYDAQDASAVIARTVFYDDIISNLGGWKDNFGLVQGGGCDFRKPSIRYRIGSILGILHGEEPIKLWTGYQELAGLRQKEVVAEPMGFNVLEAWEEHAQVKGFSDAALEEIRTFTLTNKLFFRKNLVSSLMGEDVVKGGEVMENSNFIWANGHGSISLFGMAATKLTASGFGGLLIRKTLEQILPMIAGGFMGPGSNLGDIGDYTTRSCSGMEMGPSVYWLESCICGKIDGVYTKNSVGQAIMHSGVNALIAASTTSNIGGGYVEPKTRVYDLGFETLTSYLKAKQNAKNGKFSDPHFGYRIYDSMCEDLRENDCSIGMALRNAKNEYIELDADWLVWWSPPLVKTGDMIEDAEYYKEMSSNYQETSSGSPEPMMKNKYTSYQEYVLFGDPAFNPYEPINNG